jgi:hypothetical protein
VAFTLSFNSPWVKQGKPQPRKSGGKKTPTTGASGYDNRQIEELASKHDIVMQALKADVPTGSVTAPV